MFNVRILWQLIFIRILVGTIHSHTHTHTHTHTCLYSRAVDQFSACVSKGGRFRSGRLWEDEKWVESVESASPWMCCQGFTAGMRLQYSLLLICVDHHLFYGLVYWFKVDLLWYCAFNNVQLSFFLLNGAFATVRSGHQWNRLLKRTNIKQCNMLVLHMAVLLSYGATCYRSAVISHTVSQLKSALCDVSCDLLAYYMLV